MGLVKVEDILTCCKCNDIMTMPTTLNCFHSYCEKCIEELHEQSSNSVYHMNQNPGETPSTTAYTRPSEKSSGIVCFVCGVYTRITDVVSKYVLNKCLDVYNLKQEIENSSCLNCGDRRANSKCVDCDIVICSNCHESHKTDLQLHEHKVLDLGENVSDEKLLVHPIHCNKHEGQLIELHCVQCQVPICDSCKQESHGNHVIESVDVAVRKLLPEVKQRLENFRRRIKQLQVASAGFDMDCQSWKKDTQLVKKQISDYKNRLVAKIEKDCNNLLQDLDRKNSDYIADLNSKKNWVAKEIKHQESVISWVTNISSLFSGACLLMEVYTSMLHSVSSQDKSLPTEPLSSNLINPSFQTHLIIPDRNEDDESKNLLGKVVLSNAVTQHNHYATSGRKITGVSHLHEYLEPNAPKLEVIKDEELLMGEAATEDSFDDQRVKEVREAASPHSVTSDRHKNVKPVHKQVSFVKTLITSLPEDERLLGSPAPGTDGRMSRASERQSRASINLPLSSSQNSRNKGGGVTGGSYSRLSVASSNVQPHELGWSSKRNRSSSDNRRSPNKINISNNNQEEAQSGNDKQIGLYSLTTDRSFRCIISSKFSDLTSVVCKPTGEFRIKNFHHRMCLIEDEIWMPLTEENAVAIYSTAGSLLKESLQLPKVEKLNALHPLNEDSILLAAGNGLFILYSNSLNVSLLLKGNFADVCVDKTTAVTLECKVGKIYVLDFTNKRVQKTSFKLDVTVPTMYISESKLVFADNKIWISIYNDCPLLVYDVAGTKTGELGYWGKGAAGNLGSPKVCGVDNRGNILVADFSNNRLQVMDSSNKWYILLTHVNRPKDAVVLEGGLLYILTDDHKILMFRAEKVGNI